MVSAISVSSAWGTGKREWVMRVWTTVSASSPAARAFHRASGVIR